MDNGRKKTVRAGFSLLELVVVIGILGVLLTIGIVNQSRSRSNRQLDGAADEMVNALKYARQCGISYGGSTVTFTNSNPAVYTVTATVNGANTLLKKFTLPLDISITPAAGMNPLTFAANGSASEGGTIAVKSLNTGRTGTLTVLQTAGTVTVTIQ